MSRHRNPESLYLRKMNMWILHPSKKITRRVQRKLNYIRYCNKPILGHLVRWTWIACKYYALFEYEFWESGVRISEGLLCSEGISIHWICGVTLQGNLLLYVCIFWCLYDNDIFNTNQENVNINCFTSTWLNQSERPCWRLGECH